MRIVKALIRMPRARLRRAVHAARLACARVELAHVRRCMALELELHVAKSASLAGQAVHIQRQIAALQEHLDAGART